MPNWCNNIITITPAEGEILSENVALAMIDTEDGEEVLSFDKTYPVPEKVESTPTAGHDWRVNNWGTKWDARDTIVEENTPARLKVAFLSAWSPPEPWIRFVSKLYPTATVRLDYMELGNQFAGHVSYKDGELLEIDDRNHITREDYEVFGWDVEDFDEDFGDD